MVSSGTSQLVKLLGEAPDRSLPQAFPTGFGAASQKPSAATFGEALNIVQAREDFKRRKDGGKSKSKSKATTPLVEPSAGSGGLAVPEHSAFWLFVEGYLRDLTQEDLAFLQPYTGSLLDDPILLCPPLGFDDELLIAEQSNVAALSSLKSAIAPDLSVNEAEPLPNGAASERDADPGMGRKSRRLLSRFQKEAEARKAAVEAQQAQSQTQAALAGLTADGKVADFLLQTCSHAELDTFASQMAVVQGVPDLSSLQGRDSPVDAPAAGTARALVGPLETEGQSFHDILAWLCAQAEGDGVLPGSLQSAQHGMPPVSQPQDSWQGRRVTAAGRGAPPAWLWDHQHFGVPSDAHMHPHTALMLRQPLPPHAGEVIAPTRSRRSTSNLNSDSDSEAGSDGPGPKDELAGYDPEDGLMASSGNGAEAKEEEADGAGNGVAPPLPGIKPPLPKKAAAAQRHSTHTRRRELGPGGTPKRGTPHRPDRPDKPPKAASDKSALGRKHGSQPSRKAGPKQAKASKAIGKPLPGDPKVRSATAQAVADCIAAGPKEGPMEEQWSQLAGAADLLAEAPEDEILAELLMCQAELLQQATVNRPRLLGVLAKAAADAPARQAEAEKAMQSEEYVRAYMLKVRTAKKVQKRERREILQREAQQSEKASEQAAHRLAGMRSRGESANKDRSRHTPSAAHQARPDNNVVVPEAVSEIIDALAERTEEEEALCAVCGGGMSEAPNVIVFCERCDLAVHQQCYNVAQIPDGEWLCWPCRLYEGDQAALGVPKATIRPPRWDPSAAAARDAGGSRTVTCKLCPVRHGAFRQTVDGHFWVHQ
ncbi:hypothetical protein WJX84_009316, partial [Apatococcus fuscideae]